MGKDDVNKPLTESQKRFCREYIYDYNGTRAYKKAYPGVKDTTARSCASDLLAKPNVQAEIQYLKDNLEMVSGLSKLRILKEHEKIAFSSIAHLHNTWITKKDFEELTEEQKACIEEISTTVRTLRDSKGNSIGETEFVKVKLYNKQKSLDSISSAMGFNAPIKIDNLNQAPTNIFLSINEVLKNKVKNAGKG